jgi:hypothetical protein
MSSLRLRFAAWTGLTVVGTPVVAMVLGQALGSARYGGPAPGWHTAMLLAGLVWSGLAASSLWRTLPDLSRADRALTSALLGCLCKALGVLTVIGLFYLYLLAACWSGNCGFS